MDKDRMEILAMAIDVGVAVVAAATVIMAEITSVDVMTMVVVMVDDNHVTMDTMAVAETKDATEEDNMTADVRRTITTATMEEIATMTTDEIAMTTTIDEDTTTVATITKEKKMANVATRCLNIGVKKIVESSKLYEDF